MKMIKTLSDIEEDVINCSRCDLFSRRQNSIVGTFPQTKNGILFVAKAPGKIEDITGTPLTGPHGRIFTETVFETLNLTRKDYNISYCVKCYPNINGITIEPSKETLFWCAEHLFDQIELLDPLIIIALGGIVTSFFLRRKDFQFKTRKINMDQFMGHLYKTKSALYNKEYFLFTMKDPFKWHKNKRILAQAKTHLMLVGEYINEIKSGKDMEDILRSSPTVS